MQRPLVGVIIGGRSDFNVMRRGLETLRVMGVPYIFEVISPHRNPQQIAEFARTAGEQGIEVLIAAEGGSSLIANHLATNTTLPVIGVPIDATPLRGQDSLFSLVMLPPGLPVATVGINNSENAVILATQILALKHPEYRTVLAHRRMHGSQRTESVQKELVAEYPDLCAIERTAPLATNYASTDTESGDELSESVTPDPPEQSERIRPGATYVERPATKSIQSLVSTPIPQEPGTSTITPPPTADMVLKGKPQDSNDSKKSEAKTPVRYEIPKNNSEESSSDTLSDDSDSDPGIPDQPKPSKPATPKPEESAKTTEKKEIKTKIFKVNREDPNDDLIDHAMMVLLEGGIVGLPTDTVYGLAADATNKDALSHLYGLKGNENNKTLGVLIHHPDMLDGLVSSVPPALEKVIEECWPGALTIILPKDPNTLADVTKLDRIGVRIPSDKLCLAIIEKVGRPIVVRNASINPQHPISSADPLIDHFNGHIECILDGGDCVSSGGASTVLSALDDQFEILREGGVSRKRLKELLGSSLKNPS